MLTFAASGAAHRIMYTDQNFKVWQSVKKNNEKLL